MSKIIFFCERVRTSCCISLTNFKKPIILPEIVGFFKFVSEIKQLVRKRSQKKKSGGNFTLHFTSYLSIRLSKFLRHSKTITNAKKLQVFGKNDFCCLSNCLQTNIF